MRIGEDVYLNVPFDEWYCERSQVEMVAYHDGWALEHQGRRFAIEEIYPLPGYLGESDAEGNRFDEIAYSHLDRIRLSPIVGCAYDCAFCDLPGRISLRSPERILAAVRKQTGEADSPPG